MEQSRPILITGATVLTMDAEIGDLPVGDVLIEGHTISRIAASIAPPEGAIILDRPGRIVIPGLVNCHMHTWQTALRGLTSNWTLFEYFRWVHAGLATAYRPDDIHIATLAGALGQINAGATTLGDWCHNNPTQGHTDAAVAALIESGIRAVFLHGSPKPDPQPGKPHFSEIPHPRSEILRLLNGALSKSNDLVTLGMAILGPHYSTLDVTLADFRLAREHGLIASMHQGGGAAKAPGGWEVLEAEGLIGPAINITHGNSLTDGQIERFVRAGVTFTVTPEHEMTQGHGWPITGRVLRAGGRPSFGVDIESLTSTDMFTVARMALGCERALDNAREREATGGIPETTPATTRQALGWLTMEGARALGLDAVIGSLTPGKRADIVVLDATAWNMCPVHDPYSSVVMQAGVSNVEDVIIDGTCRKLGGKLLWKDAERVKADLSASGGRIVRELGIPTQVPFHVA